MKNDSSAVLLWVIIAILFFSHNSISETRHWYTGNCGSGWAGDTIHCNDSNEKPELNDTKYTVTPSASTVVYKINDYLPELLEHCAITDAENWQCPNKTFQELIFNFNCNDGQCLIGVGWTQAKEHWKQLNFFEYYLLKIRNYTSSQTNWLTTPSGLKYKVVQ